MDKYYQNLSEDELRTIAKIHFGMCDDGSYHPDDLAWMLEPEFSLEALVQCIDKSEDSQETLQKRWISWFRNECEEVARDLGGIRCWDELAEEEIQEPIIISIANGKIQIWDGWHRTGGSFAAGREAIPAIVGTPRNS